MPGGWGEAVVQSSAGFGGEGPLLGVGGGGVALYINSCVLQFSKEDAGTQKYHQTHPLSSHMPISWILQGVGGNLGTH